MDDVLMEAVKQVPSLTVLVGVVIIFLRFNKFQIEQNRAMYDNMAEALHENSRALTEAVNAFRDRLP